MREDRFHIQTFPAFSIPCERFVSFGAVHRTDNRLIENHTSLSMALYYCERSRFAPYNEFAFMNEPTSEDAQRKIIDVLKARKAQPWRVTANDRWTAFYHYIWGGEKTLVIACQDKVDATMFRMEWPIDDVP